MDIRNKVAIVATPPRIGWRVRDATNKWPGETHREWGRTMRTTPEVTAGMDNVWQGFGL